LRDKVGGLVVSGGPGQTPLQFVVGEGMHIGLDPLRGGDVFLHRHDFWSGRAPAGRQRQQGDART
jgi:hypothetical protein